LGSGLVGSAIIKDLAHQGEFRVTAVDTDPRQLGKLPDKKNIDRLHGDIRDREFLHSLLSSGNLLVIAVPGHLGYQVLEQAVEQGNKVIDISFAPENPLRLHDKARAAGAQAIVDMGVAPGMSHVLAGCAARDMDEIHTLRILVGGLPRERIKPFEYKAGFSPVDVIEEYTRPARLIVNGQIVRKEALSEVEPIDIPPVGTLEAFNSDGLRTLLFTVKADNMVEKTLRYPGHAALMKTLRDSGFFSERPLALEGGNVTPRSLTSALLFHHWEMRPEDEDLTVMRVIALGKRDYRRVVFAASLFDEYDRQTNIHSMARTTGYAATAALRLLASGKIRRKGIIPPEELGRNLNFSTFLMEDQASKGIHYNVTYEREEDWSTGECGQG